MRYTECSQGHTEALTALAERQHGVFHRAQVLAAGFSPRMIHWRLQTREWALIHRSVYRLAGVPVTWEQQLMAGCLAGEQGAAASHRSAAALWELDGASRDLLEITLPTTRQRDLRGVVVHRSRGLARSDLTVINGVPVTRAPRTVVDLASVLDAHHLEVALDSALRLGLASVPHLRRRLERLGSRGRPGSASLLALLQSRTGSRPSESERELRLARLLVAAGLPEPVRQYELWDNGVFVARFDHAYPEQRIAASSTATGTTSAGRPGPGTVPASAG